MNGSIFFLLGDCLRYRLHFLTVYDILECRFSLLSNISKKKKKQKAKSLKNETELLPDLTVYI